MINKLLMTLVCHRIIKFSNRLLLFMLLLLFSSAARLEIYRWTDENGQVVYSDKPINDQAHVVRIQQEENPVKSVPETLLPQDKLLQIMQQERAERQLSRAKEKQEQKQKQQKCAKVSQALQQMRNASFLYNQTNDPHNPDVLSNEKRQAEEQKYADYLKQHC